jgi:hypothetical protein
VKNNRQSVKVAIVLVAVVVILAVVGAATSLDYLEDLTGLLASLVSLAVIVKEHRP